MGVDAVGFSPTNLQSFNRYAYANNNPYKFVDPDGHLAWFALLAEAPEAIAFIKATIFVGSAAAAGYAGSKGISHHNESSDNNDWHSPEGGNGGENNLPPPRGPQDGDHRPEITRDFFAGTRHTKKVQGQMKLGDNHSFPESVKAFQESGEISKIRGGDGVSRGLLRIRGGFNGREGTFEFMKEGNGEINHRFFRPD